MTSSFFPARPFLFSSLIVGFFALPGTSEAASFDCSKASAPDEIAICDNPDISAMDSEMAGLWYGYKALPLLMGASGNRQDEATAFLKTRSACGANVSCLRSAYTQRIAKLKSDITSGVQNYCTH
ncbi:MAG: hypothetical protein ABJN26_28960 [Stappiaceae bacterium]